MSFETDFTALLNPLAGNRVYFDTLPEGVPITQNTLLVETGAGRGRQWYVDQTLSDKTHSRVRITTMGKDKQSVADLARLVEETIAASTFQAETYGGISTMFQPGVKVYEASQDFGILYSST
jgi:hypothetical protein